MALSIQFAFRDGTSLETIAFDASLQETHAFSAQVTDFPVEEGTNISDHIRARPIELRIEAFISNNPLLNQGLNQTSSGGVNGSQRPARTSRNSIQELAKLQQLMDEGVAVTIFTGFKQYDNMALQSLEVPRDSTVTKGFMVSLHFKQIQTVQSKVSQIKQRTAVRIGAEKLATGNQAAKTPNPSDISGAKNQLESSAYKFLFGN